MDIRMDSKDKVQLVEPSSVVDLDVTAAAAAAALAPEKVHSGSNEADVTPNEVDESAAAESEVKPARTMGMKLDNWVHEAPWQMEDLQITGIAVDDSAEKKPWYLCAEDYYIGAMKLDKFEDGTFGLRAARVFLKPGAETAVFNCYDPNGIEITNMRGSPRFIWYDDEDVERKDPQTVNLNAADTIISFPSPEAFHIQNIGEDVAVVDFAFLSITVAEYALMLEMRKLLTQTKRRGA